MKYPWVEDGGECKPAHVHFEKVTIEVPAAGPEYDALPLARLIAASPSLLDFAKSAILTEDHRFNFFLNRCRSICIPCRAKALVALVEKGQ